MYSSNIYGIANMLDEYGHLHIVSEAKSNTMEGTHSGIMLFKFLMWKANTDTRATASQLRENVIIQSACQGVPYAPCYS
jgi:hypothetical protein